MAIVTFDESDKLHQDLFDSFRKDLLSDIYNKDHLYCQYTTYIDEINIVLRDLAVNELGCDIELNDFDSYWAASIFNKNPCNFGIIVGIEYIDDYTDNTDAEYIKAEGEILIEDDKLIIWNINPATLDYSSRKEFEKARRTYSFRM